MCSDGERSCNESRDEAPKFLKNKSLTVQRTGLSSYFSKKHKILMIRHFDEVQRNFPTSSGVLNYRFDPDP
jgi:hypothetical protein